MTVHRHRDFFAIFLCYGRRFVRNDDVLDFGTSFERLDVRVIRNCYSILSIIVNCVEKIQ